MTRHAVRVALLGIVVAIGSVGVWQVVEARTRRTADEVGLAVGQRPPAFSALDLLGQQQTLKQYRGRVVVLHFWATWCGYCRGEIPKLLEVYDHSAANELTILAVSIDEDAAQLSAFVEQATLPYTIIPDLQADPPISSIYGVRGVPVTYILDRDGRIAFRFYGSADLIDAVQRVMEKPTTPQA